ncbi:type VI secretion system baseplate subunit TssG [Mucilaginibacter robiniae]|uniref:Type VI secretion system baseplate subunit TssG n=1 Tax=Mucilaginibacter robiniae TaxID=2728022 RepID=A0A7L5DZJ9_9SPHI|nr:type VI secretion system baseplate subunit TssG [Mucilaginibacter robiniae]QJD96540.1 type VI secretion system baseplate subunit TssG [Mucilaginibacter robiniae]
MNVNFNQLDTDFKAVTLAAELIEQGSVAADNIVILPVGPQKRAYAKEIENVTNYTSIYRNRPMLVININREGLYDMLPEGLFHQSPASSVMITEEEMIKDIAARREEEKQARLLFAPLETELYHIRTVVELYENRLDKKSDYDELVNIFLKEWREFKCFTNEQMVILMHVLPVIHEQRNNLAFIGNVLSIMFKSHFELQYELKRTSSSTVESEHLATKLGIGILGVNFIAGQVYEPEEELTITIGPVTANQMLNYLPGTRAAQALDVLLSYFIPLQTIVNTKFVVGAECQKTVLGLEQENSCLGFTTYLGTINY